MIKQIDRLNAKHRIISSAKNWIEGEAVRQLERASGLPGMVEVVGLPDLQPGKGYPVGAVFASREKIYPYLIGNDIGCGVSLWLTNLVPRKLKIDRLLKRLEHRRKAKSGRNEHYDHEKFPFAEQLGSIGGGNHFVEIQTVENILLPECFSGLGLYKDRLMILVHSGSRGLGEMILRRHVEQFRDQGMDANSPEGTDYLKAHDQAVSWAVENRKGIAISTLDCLGVDGESKLDLPHNFLMREIVGDEELWLHRKGAVCAQEAATVIPGSRGTFTYLVRPTAEIRQSLFSLPHGAGRKWQRKDCRGRLERRFRPDELVRTALGSHVFCKDKELLYEEAPQAYKDIDLIIDALLGVGLIEVIAILKPLVTIKG